MLTHTSSPYVVAYRRAFKTQIYRWKPWAYDDVRKAFRNCADIATAEVVLSINDLAEKDAAQAAIRAFRLGAGQQELELVPVGVQMEARQYR